MPTSPVPVAMPAKAPVAVVTPTAAAAAPAQPKPPVLPLTTATPKTGVSKSAPKATAVSANDAAAARQLVSEDMPEDAQRHVSFPQGLPSSQISMLHQLASLSLEYASPVAPGQVTAGQQHVLDAWRENASSDYSQYMAMRGMSALAENPNALFSEEAGVAQSQWSAEDTKGALKTLSVSAKDYDEYKQLEQKKHEGIMKEIEGAVEIVAGIAVMWVAGWTGVGLYAGAALVAAGGETMSSA